jgi:TonB family protein
MMRAGVLSNLFFIALLLVGGLSATILPTSAQAKPAVAKPMKMPAILRASNKLPHTIIIPGNPYYSAALAATGVQGEVQLELQLSKAGYVQSAKIIRSSKSAELDKQALAFSRTQAWPAAEMRLVNASDIHQLNIIFLKDSTTSINTKTCADFNIDLKYFQSINETSEPHEMAALKMLGRLFSERLIKNADAEKTLQYVKKIKDIETSTVSFCNKNQQALLLKSYIKAANAHGVKF